MKDRLQEFDIIRVIATFTVIGIHVTAAYVLTSPVGYLGNQLARFAVPMFIPSRVHCVDCLCEFF